MRVGRQICQHHFLANQLLEVATFPYE